MGSLSIIRCTYKKMFQYNDARVTWCRSQPSNVNPAPDDEMGDIGTKCAYCTLPAPSGHMAFEKDASNDKQRVYAPLVG